MYKIIEKQEGQNIISKKDVYLSSMSDSVMKAKMRTSGKVTENEFIEYLRDSISEFTPQETERLKRCLTKIQDALNDFGLRNPVAINIVKTNGNDEWNSAYTRGNTIFLPNKKLDSYDEENLYKLLLHEYFHVYSRVNDDIRKDLYGLLAFKKYDTTPIPESIMKHVIFNPDAMELVSAVIDYNGEEHEVIPLIIMEDIAIDSSKDITKSIQLKAYFPELNCLENLSEIESLKDILLMNTDFPQHPEETLAENFVLLIDGWQDHHNKDFLNRMRSVIREKK